MNTAVVLSAVLLGRALDTALAWGQGQAISREVLWAGKLYAGAMALYQGARLVKRWELRSGNQRIRASIRADALTAVDRCVVVLPQGYTLAVVRECITSD